MGEAKRIQQQKGAIMKVQLSYFKTGGKWYSNGDYDTSYEYLYEIWCEVEKMAIDGILPGLVEGVNDFIILVNVPKHMHGHPHLIMPPKRLPDIDGPIDSESVHQQDAIHYLTGGTHQSFS